LMFVKIVILTTIINSKIQIIKASIPCLVLKCTFVKMNRGANIL
jgi:hypothetical protein